MVCEETIRSLYDSICVVRDCIQDDRIVIGGGSIEVALYVETMKFVEELQTARLDQ